MTLFDFFLVVVIISLAVLVGVLAPAIIQLNRSARKAETLFDTLNQQMGPLLTSLSATSKELQTLASSLNDKVGKTDQVIDTMKHSADTLLLTSNILKNTVSPIVTQVGGFYAGLRTFSHFFSKSSKSKANKS